MNRHPTQKSWRTGAGTKAQRHKVKVKALKDKVVLVTAGPTREYIDPVRYISNASSGVMGFAIAREAVNLGARVILISGPVSIKPVKGARFIPVVSALEMKREVDKRFSRVDYVVCAAAVSDYRPAVYTERKIKKSGHSFQLTLIKNPDIIGSLGKKRKKQKLIGFALETHNLIGEAKKKLNEKNLDIIYANTPSTINSGRTQGYIIGKTSLKRVSAAKSAFAKIFWRNICSLI